MQGAVKENRPQKVISFRFSTILPSPEPYKHVETHGATHSEYNEPLTPKSFYTSSVYTRNFKKLGWSSPLENRANSIASFCSARLERSVLDEAGL